MSMRVGLPFSGGHRGVCTREGKTRSLRHGRVGQGARAKPATPARSRHNLHTFQFEK